MDEDVKEILWMIIILGLIGLAIGAYFGYQNAGVCGSVVAGIFGGIIVAGLYTLGPGISDW